MSKKRSFAFILNPMAGRGKVHRLESRLFQELRRLGISYVLERTSEPFHATRLAKDAATRHCDVIVAVGGDGTVHEVANGLIGSESTLGVLPSGSGNDFGRLVGIPQKIEQALNSILTGTRKKFDVGRLRTVSSLGESIDQKYFINSLGVGLNASIAYESRRIRWLRGIPLYLLATLRVLRTFKPLDFKITMESGVQTRRAFLVCVGNGNFEGGGFKMTPNADPMDQQFEVCIIDSMPLHNALRVLPKVMQGRHDEHPGVQLESTRRISVESKKPFTTHADGEIVGSDILKIDVNLRPRALNVLIPRVVG